MFLRLMVLLLAILGVRPALSNAIVIDFESFVDGETITTQIPGLTFTNTVVATAGISLNEIDFSPHSGSNVVLDSGGPISIVFDTPILGFGAYFTYIQRLTLVASGPAVPPTVPVFSMFSNNTGTGGDPGSSPNEFVQASFPGGITLVQITGNPAGGSFAMDDVTLVTGPSGVVPEPGTAGLVLLSLSGLIIRAQWRASVGK